MAKTYKYKAFISYSHKDKKWGDWLHKNLETFKVPKNLVGKQSLFYNYLPHKLIPIFRDREELSTSSELGKMIDDALTNSSHLIVICSPRSAKSQWVNQEVLQFKRMGKANRILCLIVDGEPFGADKTDLGMEECFPQAIKYKLGSDGNLSASPAEPIAGDARIGKDEKENALLKLIAGLLGIGFDQLKQREAIRKRQRLIFFNTISLSLLTLMTALTIWAFAQRKEADSQKELALESKRSAELARDEAFEQKKIADLANEKAKQENYYNQIGLADAKIREGNYESAQNLLWGTDPKLRHWEWGRLLNNSNQSILTIAFKHSVSKSEFSADGKYAVVIGNGPDIGFIDMLNGVQLESHSFASNNLRVLASSPINNQFASAGKNGMVYLWECPTGKIIRTFDALVEGAVTLSDLAFSKDGKFLAVGATDGKIRIWSLESGKIFRLIDSSPLEIHSLTFLSDDHIVAGYNQGLITSFNFKSGQQLKSLEFEKKHHNSMVEDLELSPSGKILAAAHHYDIQLIEVESFEVTKKMPHTSWVWSCDYSSNGEIIATGCQDGSINLWDTTKSDQLHTIHGHSMAVGSVNFFPKGKGVMSSSNDGTLNAWQLDSKKADQNFGNRGGLKSTAITKDKKIALTVANSISLIDLEYNSFLRGFGNKHQEKIEKAIFCLNDSRILSLCGEGMLALFEKNTGKFINYLLHGQEIRDVFAYENGTKVLAIKMSKEAVIIDLVTQRPVKTIPLKNWTHVLNGNSQLVSPSGKFLATFSGRNLLEIFDSETGNTYQKFKFAYPPNRSIQSAKFAFSPDDTHFLITDHLRTTSAWVYNMKTRNPEIHINHGGNIQSLDYSKDGKRIITNSTDQNLKVWESSTGRELLSVPASMAKSVKFSPDGMWLVANYPWQGKIFKAEDWNQNRGKFELKQKSIFRKWALANAQK